jgi:membrane-associated phospholipid phosphatase
MRCRRGIFDVLPLSIAIVLGAGDARAQELRYDLPLDLSIIAAGVVGWTTLEILKADLAPTSCRWSGRTSEGEETLNPIDRGVRNALRWDDTAAAGTVSNVLGFAVAPLVTGGVDALAAAHDSRSRGIGVDVLVVGEASVIALDINQVVKFIAGRERPFVCELPPHKKGTTPQPSDNNVSFFSGHTTATTVVAVSAGTVASMRGYRWAPAVWATGLTLSVATGYLRIAADKHYFTDVLTGAIVGAAIGVLIPFVFHHPDDAPVGATGSALSVSRNVPNVIGVSGLW